MAAALSILIKPQRGDFYAVGNFDAIESALWGDIYFPDVQTDLYVFECSLISLSIMSDPSRATTGSKKPPLRLEIPSNMAAMLWPAAEENITKPHERSAG
jgi:hypothetical protein